MNSSGSSSHRAKNGNEETEVVAREKSVTRGRDLRLMSWHYSVPCLPEDVAEALRQIGDRLIEENATLLTIVNEGESAAPGEFVLAVLVDDDSGWRA